MLRFIAFVAALLISLSALAHAYHASIMEVHFNAKTQQLEVALKAFTDDLETALSNGQPKRISLLEMPAEQAKPLVATYLRRAITFGSKSGETLPLQYLGMERDKDAHWLYFAVKMPNTVQTVQLRHRFLQEQFADQMNIVNLEAGGKKQSALFRSGADVQALSW